MPHPNPKGKTYLLKGVPVDIYEAAQKKAAENRPPLSMRWVLITLLEKWVGQRPPSADPPPKVPKKRGRPAKIRPIQTEARQTVDGLSDLDLSSTF